MNPNKYTVGSRVRHNGVVYKVVDFRFDGDAAGFVYDLVETDGDGELLDIPEDEITPEYNPIGFANMPEKCAKQLVEYFVCDNEEDYVAQQKWCLLLLESAIYIMLSHRIDRITACGKEYDVRSLMTMAKEAAGMIAERE